jgi:hypothetical protein
MPHPHLALWLIPFAQLIIHAISSTQVWQRSMASCATLGASSGFIRQSSCLQVQGAGARMSAVTLVNDCGICECRGRVKKALIVKLPSAAMSRPSVTWILRPQADVSTPKRSHLDVVVNYVGQGALCLNLHPVLDQLVESGLAQPMTADQARSVGRVDQCAAASPSARYTHCPAPMVQRTRVSRICSAGTVSTSRSTSAKSAAFPGSIEPMFASCFMEMTHASEAGARRVLKTFEALANYRRRGFMGLEISETRSDQRLALGCALMRV